MPVFAHRAIDAGGAERTGTLEAETERAAVAALRARGLVVTEIAEAGAGAEESIWERDLLAPAQLADLDAARVARELATLLEARVPVDRALAILERTAPTAKMRRWTRGVAGRVRGGARLSDALGAARPPLAERHLGLVRAGEASGHLPEALSELAAFLERAAATRARIRGALVYPAFTLLAAGATLVLLVTMVLPSFESVFTGAGRTLPEPAGSILAAGKWLRANGGLVASGLGALALLLFVASRTEGGRLALSRAALALPLTGEVKRKLDTARWCRTYALLAGNGVDAASAAAAARAAMAAPALRARLAGVEGALVSGSDLAEALRAAGGLSRAACDLAEVGQEAGRLPQMLRHAADLLDGQAERRAAALVTLIAPIATIVLGGMVAVVILSVMSAMLQLNQLV